MKGVMLITGGVIFWIAAITNPSLAVKLGISAVGCLGMTFIFVKMTEPVNKGASEIINFTGYSLSASALVGIVGLAMRGIGQVGNTINIIWDKITFWN